MEFIAASKIQDHVRKSARNRKLTQTVGKRADYILYAIRRVQSRFMSRLVRKRFLKLRETAGMIQKWARMIIWRRYYIATMKWVRGLQQVFRKRRAIRLVDSLRTSLMIDAEMKVYYRNRNRELTEIRQAFSSKLDKNLPISNIIANNIINPNNNNSSIKGNNNDVNIVNALQLLAESLILGGKVTNGTKKYKRVLLGIDYNQDLSSHYSQGWLNALIKFREEHVTTNKLDIVTMGIGGSHSVLIDESCNVFAYGYGNHGQLCNSSYNNKKKNTSSNSLRSSGTSYTTAHTQPYPKCAEQVLHLIHRLEANKRKRENAHPGKFGLSGKNHIMTVACGKEHTLLLTDNGEAIAWGGNSRGQLGLGYNDFRSINQPKRVGISSITNIACGQYHSACLTGPGVLYTWGAGEYNGHGPSNDSINRSNSNSSSYRSSRKSIHFKDDSQPKQLACNGAKRVYNLVCGDSFTVVRCGNNLYSWGKDINGQLGRKCTFKSPDYLPGVIDINILDSTTTTTTTSNSFNSDDNIMNNITNNNKYEPITHNAKSINESKQSYTLVCGGKHVCFATSQRLFCWGWNKYGQVGNGTTDDVALPYEVVLPMPITFKEQLKNQNRSPVGGIATAIVDATKDKNKNIYRPSYKQVLVGRRHSMVITNDSSLFIWGHVQHFSSIHGRDNIIIDRTNSQGFSKGFRESKFSLKYPETTTEPIEVVLRPYIKEIIDGNVDEFKFNCFGSSQISVTTVDIPEQIDSKKFDYNDDHYNATEDNGGGSPSSVSTTNSNRNQRTGHHSPNKNTKDLGSGRFITRLDKSHLQKELASVEPEQILKIFRNIRRNVHEAPKQSKSNWRIKSMLEKRKREGVLKDSTVLDYFDLRSYQTRSSKSNDDDQQFHDDNDYITSSNNRKERGITASHSLSATTLTTDTDDKTTTNSSTQNNRVSTSQPSSVSISKSLEQNNTLVSAHEVRQLQELLQDLDFKNSSNRRDGN